LQRRLPLKFCEDASLHSSLNVDGFHFEHGAMSLVDAVDGSSTGTSVPWMWALLRLQRFRGESHADDHDNRFRHRQVGFPSSWVDAGGQVVIRRQLKRRYVLAFFQKVPPCLVGIEAWASSPDNGFTIKKFLACLEPSLAICSADYDDQYDHPRDEIRDC
jgi:hypothetical protein